MDQLQFLGSTASISKKTPPYAAVVLTIIACYKLWHEYLPHMPKTARYSLGGKIDAVFTELIEATFQASYATKEQKLPYLTKASVKLDTLKLFLRIGWEIRGLDNKKYVALSEKLDESGRMIGGWQRQAKTQTPA